jgi:two-component system, cell cycle sensor histidine kinase and response regulator CckA
MKGRSLYTYVYDYNFWDDMVKFVAAGDSDWAEENINVSLKTYDATAAWIYRTDFKLVYAAHDSQLAGFEALPVPPESWNKLFARENFCHFFINTSQGMMEIRGAPIQPTNDVRRESPARGFFLVGRLWDQKYIAELSNLTECKIRLFPSGDRKANEVTYDRTSGLLQFTQALPGWNGAPAMIIQAQNESEVLLEMNRSSELHFRYLVLFAAAIMILISLPLMRWVSTPLNLLSRSLSSKDPSILDGLAKNSNEFGHMAQLITEFFRQNNELIKEVAERKQAEIALRENEKYLQTLLDSIRAGIFVVDAETHLIIDANLQAQKAIGISKEMIVGRECHGFICPADKGNCPVTDLGKEVDYSERVIRKTDGSEIPILKSVVPVVRRGKKYLIESFLDITERKQIEELLRQSEEKYRRLIDNMLDGVGVADLEENIIFVNPAAANITGYSQAELIGMNMRQIVIPEDMAMIYRETEKRKRKEESKYEINFIHKSGERRLALMSASPFFGRNGEVEGTLGVFADITELRRAELERQELQTKLERARRMESLAILAGGVAHDLNNILGPLVAYPELIASKLPPNSPVQKQVDMLGRSAQEAANVIQDLLTMARRGRYDMVPTNLNQVLEDFMNSPAYLRAADLHPGVRIEKRFDLELPLINGSATHLMKVIMNLIINAFDAMPEGGNLVIETAHEYLRKLIGGFDCINSGEYVLLRIKDTGTGINAKDIRKIFEPYFSKKKMGTSGSGLGLAVVYGVVKDHHGYYDVISQVGKGTEFILYFPAAEVPAEDKSVGEKPYSGHETVLVIDDLEEQREVATELLSSLGYTIYTAVNGHEAISLMKQKTFDLVVLDMILETDYDGLDTFRDIINIKPDQRTVIVSGFSSTERVGEMQELGAGKFIRKPYTREAIGRAIREELDKGKPPDNVPSTPDLKIEQRTIPI